MNDPGKSNGLVRLSIDGKLLLERKNRLWTNDKNNWITGFVISHMWGGTEECMRPKRTQQEWFRNFKFYACDDDDSGSGSGETVSQNVSPAENGAGSGDPSTGSSGGRRLVCAPAGGGSGGGGSGGFAAAGPSEVAACTGKTINVTPATIQKVINENDNVTLNLAPGRYVNSGRSLKIDRKQCMHLRCTQSAIVNGSPNMNGCVFHNQLTSTKNGNISIKQLTFAVDNTGKQNNKDYHLKDYGIRVYDTKAIHMSSNAFANDNNHDISTKDNVGYAEIFNNLFVRCTRHCIEAGQNANIPSNPATSGKMIVRGNIFDRPKINAITQRSNRTLIVENNEFINTSNFAIQNWPWRGTY